MPNAKTNRKAPVPPEPASFEIPSCAVCILRELAPLLRKLRPPRTESTKHLRNAAIELLEAVRTALDETIEWLRKQEGASELKRIRVE